MLDAGTGLISGAATTASTYNVTAQVSDGRGGSASRAFLWIVASGASGPVRFVKLEALSEVNGNAWASMAEFNLFDPGGVLISRTSWVASADSEGSGYPAASAIDADATSFWHTSWAPANTPMPHSFVVDMGAAHSIGGFKVLPRQDGGDNGKIANWRFSVSADGVAWVVMGQGTFAASSDEKTVAFPP